MTKDEMIADLIAAEQRNFEMLHHAVVMIARHAHSEHISVTKSNELSDEFSDLVTSKPAFDTWKPE